MKIAIPTTDGKLNAHFGHCQCFTFLTVDTASQHIGPAETKTPPPHEPGLFPAWLKEEGVDLVIAGSMGQRAQSLFEKEGIALVIGAPNDTPEHIAAQYLAGSLSTGANTCDH